MKRSTQLKLEENEAAFRHYNEQIQRGIDDLRSLAKERDQEDIVVGNDQVLEFLCECSNEDCVSRIKIELGEYARIHKVRSHFTIVCGHNIPAIEHVVGSEDEYCIVEKYTGDVKDVTTLKPTEL